MKKVILVTLAWLLLSAMPALGANTNPNGAITVPWNLSGAVMPVPPYGLHDIVGSDTASKLIFNQPNGKVSAMLTGVMKGLEPNMTYTVYLSNSYTKFTALANVAGPYTMDVLYESNHYFYNLTLTQTGNTIGGILHDPYLPGDLTVTGTLSGNAVVFSVTYPTNYQGTRTFTGTIDNTGNLSGDWTETGTENGADTWSTTGGSATLASGSTGWPGQLAGTEPFTFTTSSDGTASWHYNFKGEAPSAMSVWINGGGATILISDPITLP